MEIYSARRTIEKWINHPGYVIFCFVIGCAFWTLSFESKKNKYENIQLSSFAKNLNEVHKAEMVSINRLSVERVNNRNVKQLPKKFRSNPAFQLFIYIEELVSKPDAKIVRKVASEIK